MTVGGWAVYLIIAICVMCFGIFMGMILEDNTGLIISIIISVVLVIALLIGMLFYYNKTEAGKRAFKSQESNFNNGIERTVEVYDATGNLLKTYNGKFDIDYDDNRIIFDDENGKRHVIYYPTGTVIVDEK